MALLAERGPGRDALSVPWPRLFAVAAALALLYAATLARVQTWETLSQAARAADDPLVSERYFSARLYHPSHLFYMPVARTAHRVAAAAGHSDPFRNLALLSALAGGCLCALAGALAASLGSGPRRAVAVALLAGVSNIVWRLSTEIGAIVPAAALLVLAAIGIARARGAWGWALAGLALAAAALVHQMAVMFALGAGLVLGVTALRGGMPWRGFAAWAACTALPVALAYAAVARAAAGARTPAGLLAWVLVVRDRSTAGVLPALTLTRDGAVAALESWVTLVPLHALRASRADTAVVAGVVAIAIALGAAGWWIARAARPLARGVAGRFRLAAVAAGGVAVLGFVCWYQPGNHIFWVFAPPFALALTAAVAPPLPAARHRLVAGVLLASAAAAMLANLAFRVLPARDPARAPYADLLALAPGTLRPGDLVVTGPGAGVLREGAVALPVLRGIEVWMAPPADDPRVVAFLSEAGPAIVRARAAGGRVFALGANRAIVEPREDAWRAAGVVRGDTLWRSEPTE